MREFLREIVKGHEPVLLALLVRAVVLGAAATLGVTLAPEVRDAIAVIAAAVLGIEAGSAVFLRDRVTPVAKLPPSERG